MNGRHALAFECVSVRYETGAAAVLSDLTFSISAGERVALLGLNGSGKTTLLMATVGLVGYQGTISVYGIRVDRRTTDEVREKIGFLFNVPEDQLLFPLVVEDTAFGLLSRGEERGEAYRRAAIVLDELGAGGFAGWPIHKLSHGQKLRVALAGALITRPPLLLLDEPSAGLDPPGKAALSQVLGRLDAAMLLASHDLEFAERLCRRFIAIDGGRIVYDGGDISAVRQMWGMGESESKC
jgi:cobalt/nickel transport system ATP-binding protein